MAVAKARYGRAAAGVEVAFSLRIDDLDAGRRRGERWHGTQVTVHQSRHRGFPGRRRRRVLQVQSNLTTCTTTRCATRADAATSSSADGGAQRAERAMERKKMNGGSLRAAGYAERARKLVVELTAGTFEYTGVPSEVWRRFSTASSPWSYYRDNIDEEYPSHRTR
jgi:hypothetical protein